MNRILYLLIVTMISLNIPCFSTYKTSINSNSCFENYAESNMDDTNENQGVVSDTVKDNVEIENEKVEIDKSETEKELYNEKQQKINMDHYQEKLSFYNFTEHEVRLINDVLDLYNKSKNSGSDYYEEVINYIPSYDEYRGAMSFFHIYYGIAEDIYDVVFDVNVSNNTSASIGIYVENMKKFEAERSKNTQKMKEVLSTFNDGSEKEKVLQIIEYVVDQTTYVKGNHDVSDLMFNRKGVCNAYALTVLRFCQLLGIQCDLCIGPAGGDGHAWNKITYSDGSVEYVDATFFDSNRNEKYLGLNYSPHTIESINRYYY